MLIRKQINKLILPEIYIGQETQQRFPLLNKQKKPF